MITTRILEQLKEMKVILDKGEYKLDQVSLTKVGIFISLKRMGCPPNHSVYSLNLMGDSTATEADVRTIKVLLSNKTNKMSLKCYFKNVKTKNNS